MSCVQLAVDSRWLDSFYRQQVHKPDSRPKPDKSSRIEGRSGNISDHLPDQVGNRRRQHLVTDLRNMLRSQDVLPPIAGRHLDTRTAEIEVAQRFSPILTGQKIYGSLTRSLRLKAARALEATLLLIAVRREANSNLETACNCDWTVEAAGATTPSAVCRCRLNIEASLEGTWMG